MCGDLHGGLWGDLKAVATFICNSAKGGNSNEFLPSLPAHLLHSTLPHTRAQLLVGMCRQSYGNSRL
jgi:hypothetical protein